MDKSVEVVNLLGSFVNLNEFMSKNSIKVLCDKEYNAVLFTRSLNKSYFNSKKIILGKQVCIIPFLRKTLIKYLKLKPTSLELMESIDMWRLIENGVKVKMKKINEMSFPVDTKKDLNKVSKLIN